MVKKSRNRALQVCMNGILVGWFEKTISGGVSFRYEANWLNTPGARPISLSLPLVQKEFMGDVVYNFFDNLLPDNPQLRSKIQTYFQVPTDQPFDLLESIGQDCIGAIQLLDKDKIVNVKQVLFEPLSDKDIATTLRNIQNIPLGMTNKEKDFRISLAGAQEKTALLYWNNTWNRPLGTTPTTHIVKLPIGYIQHQNIDLTDSCENEMLCAQIVAGFGLPVAPCRIQTFEDIKALIVERFDRRLASDGHWIMRLPQEDMCQALGVSSHLKYQLDGGPGITEVMKLLMGANDPECDRDIFFSAQVLFYLLAAIDGHAKNFSIQIAANGKYNLAPLYDIISVHPLLASKHLQPQKIKMAMALKGKKNHYHWDDIQLRYFFTTAKHAKYPIDRAQKIIVSILEKMDTVLEGVTQKLPATFPARIVEPIVKGMKKARDNLINDAF